MKKWNEMNSVELSSAIVKANPFIAETLPGSDWNARVIGVPKAKAGGDAEVEFIHQAREIDGVDVSGGQFIRLELTTAGMRRGDTRKQTVPWIVFENSPFFNEFKEWIEELLSADKPPKIVDHTVNVSSDDGTTSKEAVKSFMLDDTVKGIWAGRINVPPYKITRWSGDGWKPVRTKYVTDFETMQTDEKDASTNTLALIVDGRNLNNGKAIAEREVRRWVLKNLVTDTMVQDATIVDDDAVEDDIKTD